MHDTRILTGLVRQIQKTRKPATILFTDIEGSTKYWDRQGDVKGRLMVDRHNRLLFPVIRKYRGRVVKTIGDAIMAVFRYPEDAIHAAIGIQQILADERARDRRFQLNVRVGIHTGHGIVERADVFGDVVNVAARVESKAKGDEILVSGSTASRVKNAEFALSRQGQVMLKGKSKPMTLYKCQWKTMPSKVFDITFSSALPLIGRQKKEFLVYLVSVIGLVYGIYHTYLRYLLSDSEDRALLALNPTDILAIHPALNIGMTVVALFVLVLLFRVQMISHRMLRAIKGGFAFSLVFFIYVAAQNFVDIPWPARANKVLYSSDHLFVEVLEDDARVTVMPSLESEVIRKPGRKALLLLTDVGSANDMVWNKVLVGRSEYGWIPRIVPAQIGEPEKRVSMAYKFYFRSRDGVMMVLGLIAFVLGWRDFRIKPA
ncbi:MAG: adenylate/guanylate cyclase domain-containing protein [Gammaproteobacteria bacterium]|nr:adenylate/guanylate cyclase domain-containing protein [Gammaproteobacteria bacterium]